MYAPRVRANAYHVLTTPPRVFRDPKMCLRNIWTAPNLQPAEEGLITVPNKPTLSTIDILRDLKLFSFNS